MEFWGHYWACHSTSTLVDCDFEVTLKKVMNTLNLSLQQEFWFKTIKKFTYNNFILYCLLYNSQKAFYVTIYALYFYQDYTIK